MALPVGTQLGRYTVLKPLASSGVTEVLLARAEGMGGFAHHVVIKAIRATKTVDPSFISAFVDEARLAASLHHHHVVQVHDVGHENDTYFFAMEYVHGANLRALLTKVARAQAVVPFEQVITIALGVAAALHHAHQQGLVHRDVTPANILVGYDGNVKVTDFGIAKALARSSEATKARSMRGKVAYMAPEQCLGAPLDRRSDIFSLGVVIYELATARRLFKGDTDFLVMTSIVNGKVPRPTELRPDLPSDLEDVILKALAPKPDGRFATAEDLAMAIERAAVANGIRISPNALSAYMKEIFGKRDEPWLDDSVVTETVDVDFDGGGTGLVTVPPQPPPRAATEPVTEPGSEPRTDPGSEPRTEPEAPQDDDESATVVVPSKRAASGFEGAERTLIGEEAEVEMLVGLSKIDAGKPPEPRRDTPPLARDTVPVPTITQTQTASELESATIVEEHIPTPLVLPPPVVVPPPVASALEHHPASGIAQHLQPSPVGWSQPDNVTTGTPMAWQSDEVTSLAPRGRRIVLIAAVALPVLAIVVLALALRDGEPRAGRHVTPDAFVAPDAAADAAPDAR